VRVLFVCHNHPALYPGGTEAYALHVFKEMRKASDIEPIFLARVGVTPANPFRPHPGTPFGVFEEGNDEYWFYCDFSDFDRLNMRLRRKILFTTYLRDFLLAQRPDVVHVQHTFFLGVDLLRLIKNTLPDVPIVYTLHEYYPICHRGGLMVRTLDEELCDHASPERCHECFPDVSAGEFYLRKRFIESHLACVDLFLAPSQFLLNRFVEWGIPPAKIRFSEHGRVPPRPIESSRSGPPSRFGYFGQLSLHKGVLVLLEAMKILEGAAGNGESSGGREAHLRVHGANLEWETEAFKKRFHELAKSSNVTFAGRYVETELPELMAEVDWVVAPSLWWENSPLVIQEAFQYGKPVICSGIGALAEKVTHGVNGLHFERGDPESLATTIRQAAASRELWQELRAGIPPIRSLEEDVQSLIGTYRELIGSRVAAGS
jgi:glycosyltransferase involved in cell wall biosynthesis